MLFRNTDMNYTWHGAGNKKRAFVLSDVIQAHSLCENLQGFIFMMYVLLCMYLYFTKIIHKICIQIT